MSSTTKTFSFSRGEGAQQFLADDRCPACYDLICAQCGTPQCAFIEDDLEYLREAKTDAQEAACQHCVDKFIEAITELEQELELDDESVGDETDDESDDDESEAESDDDDDLPATG